MELIKLPLYTTHSYYVLSSFFGHLLRIPFSVKSSSYQNKLPPKLASVLNYCARPYTLQPNLHLSQGDESKKLSLRPKLFLSCLMMVSRFNFWLAYKFLSVARPCFTSSVDAIKYFRSETCRFDQNTLCLVRCLFGAAHSKKFKKEGAVLIGVFLPSREMHAWIIESGFQPDPLDSIWVNFEPVAAIC
jgi:hypothetical protein